jgi:hypothetical protein
MDGHKREVMLYQIRQVMHDGGDARADRACVDHIKEFSYSAAYEDLSPDRPVHRVIPPPFGLGCPGDGMDGGTTDRPKSRRSSLRTA